MLLKGKRELKARKMNSEDDFGLLDDQTQEYENPNKWIKSYELANGKKIQVKLKPASDPKDVLSGMEEFVFKYAKIMDFGEKASVDAQLYRAVLAEQSFNHRIFRHNLEKRIKEIIAETGMRPGEKVESSDSEDEHEKKRKKHKKREIPHHRKTTVAYLRQMENGPNKSNLKRLEGTKECQFEIEKQQRDRIKEYRKIEKHL